MGSMSNLVSRFTPTIGVLSDRAFDIDLYRGTFRFFPQILNTTFQPLQEVVKLLLPVPLCNRFLIVNVGNPFLLLDPCYFTFYIREPF